MLIAVTTTVVGVLHVCPALMKLDSLNKIHSTIVYVLGGSHENGM